MVNDEFWEKREKKKKMRCKTELVKPTASVYSIFFFF